MTLNTEKERLSFLEGNSMESGLKTKGKGWENLLKLMVGLQSYTKETGKKTHYPLARWLTMTQIVLKLANTKASYYKERNTEKAFIFGEGLSTMVSLLKIVSKAKVWSK